MRACPECGHEMERGSLAAVCDYCGHREPFRPEDDELFEDARLEVWSFDDDDDLEC